MGREVCRLCGGFLPQRPLLEYSDMPASAQGFLAREELDGDQGRALSVYQCPWCGLAQISGKPVPYYRQVIRASGVSEEMREFRREQFGEWVMRFGLEGKRVLEVGCGHGEYLEIMAEQPVAAYGMEYGKDAASFAKSRGYAVFRGYPDEWGGESPKEPFDGFFCLNFLEHSPDPGRFLRGIHGHLAESAAGLVEVPNFDMILRKKLFSEFISDHLLYFTADTLRRALESNGFEVLGITEIWHDYILSAVVRKRESLSMAPLVEQKGRIEEQLRQYAYPIRAKGGKLAVWGAGHQALAILAMTGIYEEVSCVIDSAPFKQGRYTPSTHLMVCAPQVLDSGEISDVLVIAGGFSDEVAGILRRDYPHVRGAILRDDGVKIC